jgi:hypothetical protein
VAVAWIPPYGITHDVLDILLITAIAWRAGAPRGEADRAAAHFLTSIRVGLCAEITFAWLFHQAADARTGVYFAADDPHWALINRLTTLVLLLAWPDLVRVLWNGRDALFPRRPASPAGPLAVDHA